MRPITEWHHAYVDLHVKFWVNVVGMDRSVRVPRWVATLMNYPDSTWIEGGRGKPTGYHVGHATAILSVLVPFVLV